MIITISRQFGSGGREFAKRLADKLGYHYYDKSIIEEIAKESSLDETYVEKVLNNTQPTPYLTGCTFSYSIMHRHTADIYFLQQKVMDKLAKGGDAIFVGRGAEVLLKEYNPFRIFVYSTMEQRLARTLNNLKPEEDSCPKKMIKRIKKIDKERIHTCRMLGFEWGKKENYDLCISTEKISPKELAEVIFDYLKKLK